MLDFLMICHTNVCIFVSFILVKFNVLPFCCQNNMSIEKLYSAQNDKIYTILDVSPKKIFMITSLLTNDCWNYN